MEEPDADRPPLDPSVLTVAGRFVAGAAITALFSGSLARCTSKAGWVTVLAVGMIVPSFTWVVQLTLSGVLLLPAKSCWDYWADLGYVCVVGSVALLPAAAVNFCLPHPPLWFSAANVLASVLLMAGTLFWRTARHGIASVWPVSWCVTITVNMLLFLWASWGWW